MISNLSHLVLSARVDVRNPEGYQQYVTANADGVQVIRCPFLVRGGRHEAAKGTHRSFNVVLEFKDYETALDCYQSFEYQAAEALRIDHSVADSLIIEGL